MDNLVLGGGMNATIRARGRAMGGVGADKEPVSQPMDRPYRLIVACHPVSSEIKHFVSSASAKTSLLYMLQLLSETQ